jgi:hypothetical protein
MNTCLSFLSLLYNCLFTEEAVQRVKREKTAEEAVLKVEVKTEVEEDKDQLEHEVRVFL